MIGNIDICEIWAINRIKFSIKIEEMVITMDLTIDEAKNIKDSLESAIDTFEEIDEDCMAYFKKQRNKEKLKQ